MNLIKLKTKKNNKRDFFKLLLLFIIYIFFQIWVRCMAPPTQPIIISFNLSRLNEKKKNCTKKLQQNFNFRVCRL
jgi:hypothetical protein